MLLAVKRRKLPLASAPPLVRPRVYSQMFQRPVQALAPPAVPSTVALLLAGHHSAKTTFLPS